MNKKVNKAHFSGHTYRKSPSNNPTNKALCSVSIKENFTSLLNKSVLKNDQIFNCFSHCVLY